MVTFTALDGYRMAVCKRNVISMSEDISVICPARTLNEIARMLAGEGEEIVVYVQKGMMLVSVDDTGLQTSRLRGIIEKPAPEKAPSRMAVIGRYVFEPAIFEYLEKVQPGVGGEIQLTDAIAMSLDDVPTYAHRFEGTRFDCGSKQGFIDATVHYARKRGFKIN